jgi:DNA-binding CsgD family transcriptional regulator
VPEAWRLRLTARETEIVGYVLENHDSEFIAERLDISPHTVKTHVRNIFEKLGVENRPELIFRAARIHLAARD